MSAPSQLPLFPLHNVLFPHGTMQLRVFEARYLDMVGECMRKNEGFGVCLIAEGEEVGAPAQPHAFGTEARIIDWDMSQPGILGLTIRGARRFRVLETVPRGNGLLVGIVDLLDPPPPVAIEARHADLLPLLAAIVQDAGERIAAPPGALEDATWVGHRYAEILPIPALARQHLLELDDSLMRLDIIQTYLRQHDLLKTG
ncbi:MAG: LON peptidase substrate-binding domain-containing protein [Candidatus Dactylopiibacterium sp.]|nr:LON peptidase substrate-binding domain-containing protein [Candidatus Dactylopiibacterium sp.]